MKRKQKTGAEVLIQLLEKEGVEYIFGYSGGAALPIFDALHHSRIKLIMARHEQGATHMADGYARATGKPGVVLVTSGPGATNTITGIMTAQMDSIPMIILTGQTITSLLGMDAFQEADIFGLSMPVVKYNYLVKKTNDIPRVVKEAFYLTSNGRPGPVLIDLPKDITSGAFTGELEAVSALPCLNIKKTVDKGSVEAMATLINKANKPIILAGHGAILSGAYKEVRALAEKINAPVTTTLLGKGAFPETHPLSIGMLGMHGTPYSNKATLECDLILSIGSRWDDRINGNPRKFCPKAKKLHIDIDPTEIGKIITPDAYAIGDAKGILQELITRVIPQKNGEWLERIKVLKARYPLKYAKSKQLAAPEVIESLYKLTEGKAIITTDVGQHQMWAAQYFLANTPDTWISSGGAGTMGFGFPSALGAKLGKPESLVVAVVGDGGFQMTLSELATAFVYNIPIKILIVDNKFLGLVRQWQDLFLDKRYTGTELVGNPDFVKLAESYHVKGFKISKAKELEEVLRKALKYNEGPCVIHAEVGREENVFPMIPAGNSAEEMILETPQTKLKMPEGST